ncbi:30S ribosomal protein S9 [Candidatus Roizmanbacteria bacterium CG_4_10_14_0_8_um_filter_39_9]|uniref:30S ribosomal protein S9 n=1 Tax=Candidatus Roizmanbacteria bacterium CG_4_10_14_0_8_um_filter_39_9 TaxID=1974829 RepID=A0A2M7QFH3_9BACT|nr:MAG: 30S ribosomal protein S9 [Candidatus Roizmanbacteria bacterium CG_4_10_14_0_8_um_filter_39_9]
MAKKAKTIYYYEAIGRRKEAVARARLYIAGKDKMAMIGDMKVKQGDIIVNKKPIGASFPSLREKAQYLNPLKLTGNDERFAISILVSGGGKIGQLDAIVLALSRAIEKTDKETQRPILKKQGLLRRDPRVRERRKVGTGGKARRVKQSPKR